VTVAPDRNGGLLRRVWRDGVEWAPSKEWAPEATIWPALLLSDQKRSEAGAPLNALQDYWSTAGDRLRDSAKWMATVIGAALAALVGTSPLRDMQASSPKLLTVVIGLILLLATLLLVMQVMRPLSVSYTDVQTSDGAHRRPSVRWPALRHWKTTVESQQDLYLPCGVKCLTSLRQAMIVEELTLVALSRAMPNAKAAGTDAGFICSAQEARAVRLQELRQAACQVATIGEYYCTKGWSAVATYIGGLSGTTAAAVIIISFT
jgi:hypothetical protein